MTEQKVEYAITKRDNSIIQNFSDVESVARAMAGSGFFQDSKQASQAIVKVLAGHELGFGPFASMTGIHIIQGKPAFGANLIAGAIKAQGKYDYRVVVLDDSHCEIEFYQIIDGKRTLLGKSSFSMMDATKAGLTGKDTWSKFPRNMLFSRAISNGARWYTPDVFSGAPVYTPEELGAEVDQDGNVVLGTFIECEPEIKTMHEQPVTIQNVEPVVKPVVKPEATPALKPAPARDDYSGVCTSDGVPYSELPIKDLSFRFNEKNKKKTKDPASFTAEDQRKLDAAEYYINQARNA
jgi:hypothetical protein